MSRSFGSIIESNLTTLFQYCFHSDTFEQSYDHSFVFIQNILLHFDGPRKIYHRNLEVDQF